METLKSIWLLIVICIISGGSLSLVYNTTQARIIKLAETERELARQEVLPQAVEFSETVPQYLWLSKKDGTLTGYVARTKVNGYGGPIELLIGISSTGELVKIKVVTQTETPGLGTKITELKFSSQFVGKRTVDLSLKKDQPTGKIDAISGATISSRAVTNGVRAAVERVEKLYLPPTSHQKVDGISHATPPKDQNKS